MAAAFLSAVPAPARAAQSSVQSIEVTLRPRWDAEPRALAITISFPAGGRRTTEVVLPTEWASGTDLQNGIRALRVVTPRARLVDGKLATTRRIEHAPGGRVTIAYELVDIGVETFAGRARFYQPLLRPAYAFFFGHGAWVLPEGSREQRVDLTFRLEALPAGWAALSSFGAQPAGRGGNITWRANGVTLGDLEHSLFALGDFRARRMPIDGKPLWVAVRGDWSFADDEFFRRTANLVRVQRQFFRDFRFPFTLIALIPADTGPGNYGGTAVYNAFAMNAASDFTVAGDAYRFLVTHEHLHTWLPQRMGPMSTLPDEEDEALRYWFSEGFTNYLTHRLLVVAGEWSLDDYARALNDVIRRYEISPARAMPNAELPEKFFKDHAAGELPYQRGELLALRWDGALRARGRTLDAVLRELVLPPAALAPGARKPALAADRLVAAVSQALAEAPAADVTHLIERAEPFDYATDLLGPCFEGAPSRYAGFELGFAPRSFEAGRVSDLVAGSAAEKAGLREGDELAGYSVNRGEPDREAVVKVKRDGTLTEIRFHPRSRNEASAFRYATRASAANDPACRRWMAGLPPS